MSLAFVRGSCDFRIAADGTRQVKHGPAPASGEMRSRLEAVLVDLVPDRLEPLVSVPRMGMFLSVGVAGALLEQATLAALVELVAVAPALAAPVGKEASILLMFVLNDRFTFAGEGEDAARPLLSRLVRSHAVRAVGVTVAYLTFLALLYGAGVHYFLANPIGIAAGFAVNYVLENVVTWRTHVEG